MPGGFHGFDHVDLRVHSLAAVERFYDELLPKLGLARKRHAHVDARGEWHEAGDERPYNAVEFYEEPRKGNPPLFFGVIEDAATRPTGTRIAFRVASASELGDWVAVLELLGAQRIEPSEDMEGYPAIFFEDPAGTKLEICARRPHASET